MNIQALFAVHKKILSAMELFEEFIIFDVLFDVRPVRINLEKKNYAIWKDFLDFYWNDVPNDV